MLQALLELRQHKKLTFTCILDGDPPQPMHEDDSDGIASNDLLSIPLMRRILPSAAAI